MRPCQLLLLNGISWAKPGQGKRHLDRASPSVISSILAIGGNLLYAVLNSPGQTKRLTVFAVMLHASQIVKTSVSLRRASRGSFAGRVRQHTVSYHRWPERKRETASQIISCVFSCLGTVSRTLSY